MKIGAIVQARVSSTRLPQKVLKELPYGSGITVLEQVAKRLSRTTRLNDIVIATTTRTDDNKIVNITKQGKIRYFRGSEEDVLSRYYLAAKENRLDIIVRITSDCPCADPEVINSVIEKHIAAKADYTSNALIRTFPHGLDTEVLNFDTLEKVHFEAKLDFEREHVCPYIYKSNPQMFKIRSVKAPQRLHAPDIRITLDTKEDYALLCTVFDCLYPENEFFRAEDILKLFHDKPWLKLINAGTVQKKILGSLENELAEATRLLDLQDLKRARDILAGYVH